MTLPYNRGELEMEKANLEAQIADLAGRIDFQKFMLKKVNERIVKLDKGHNEIAALFGNCWCDSCEP